MLNCNKLPEGQVVFAKKCDNPECPEYFQAPTKGAGRNVRYCKTPACVKQRASRSSQTENLAKMSIIKKNRKLKSKNRQCTFMIKDKDGNRTNRCDKSTGINYYFCAMHHSRVSSGINDCESYI